MSAETDCDWLPKEEKDLIAQLRARFAEELTKREAEDRAYPCFFGDVFLLRVLKAVDSDLGSAIAWFEKFLIHFAMYSLDDVVQRISEKVEKAGPDCENMFALSPYYNEFKHLNSFVPSAPKLSPSGDIICYMPMADVDKQGILHKDWDHYVEYVRGILVIRCVQLDQLSRRQKRLVRHSIVADLEGCTINSLSNETFDKAFGRDVGQFMEHCTAELVDVTYVINPPWAISAFWSSFSWLFPAKFRQKTQLISGDCLRNSDFVAKVGGQEQLKELIATRLLLTTGSQPPDPSHDGLPTEEELASVAMLRDEFAEEFEKRSAEGREHPCFFGDFALTRLLRGNDSCFSMARRWFREFLQACEIFGVDAMVEDVTKFINEAGGEGHYYRPNLIPHYDECFKYCRSVPFAPQLTPRGDLVNYIPLVDTRKQDILENVEWDHFVQYVRYGMVMRCILSDRLSRSQNRLVKTVVIWDLYGTSLSQLKVQEFDEKFKESIEQFMTSVAIELLATNYVINVPWFVVRFYNWLKVFIPDRLSRKLHLMTGDGAHDVEFVQAIGGAAQLQYLLGTRVGDHAAEEDESAGELIVKVGGTVEKLRGVRAGEVISWTFKVVHGSAAALLGMPDVEFSVGACWLPSGDTATPEPVTAEAILPPQRYSARVGTVEGSCKAERDGMVTLKWSNHYSYTRSKTIQYTIGVTRDTTASAASSVSPGKVGCSEEQDGIS
eukprot:gnl/TRDRNA2_/TRDRNA2_147223_c0_seq1.p1 gnl/TRDRNA2_/TRDRNA2_147223_c0~~gnl/TRDRNA2_/TRDRNA2_147223_c0_seq1.p1  ORF type:complete len:721 (+),score=105.47 gnl/TRDRNA2_/TRDRNA2_147223_c0_seq1:14-2176(+)